jgi:hypothetical protein
MGDHSYGALHSPPTDNREWSPADESTTDEIEATFDRGLHCSRYIVRSTDTRSCDLEYRPNPNEQECHRRIEAGPLPDDPVLILEQPPSRVFADRESEGDNSPCSSSTDQAFVTLTRTEAYAHRHPPCQHCQRSRVTQEANR